MNTMRRAGAVLLLAAAACTDGGPRNLAGPEDAKPLAYVASVSVCCGGQFYQGNVAQMYVYAYDEHGTYIYNPNAWWSSSNPSVASVSAGGLVEMRSVGYAYITATVDGVGGTVLVQVLAKPVVTTVQITPSSANIQVGQSQQLTAKAYDQNGNLISGKTATWSIDHSSVASITSGGSVQGVAVGSTTARATIDGVTASASVTVQPQFSVTIDGPTAVFSPGTYQWTASPSGGNGSYTYRWYMEGYSGKQALGTASTQSLWMDENTSGYTILTVEVTSGTQTVTGYTTVCNFISSMAC